MINKPPNFRLRWYVYAWSALPLALGPLWNIGGGVLGAGIGGGIGGAALGLNMWLMRRRRPAWERFGLSALTLLAALTASFAVNWFIVSANVDRELADNPLFAAIRRVDDATYQQMRDTVVNGAMHRQPAAKIQAAVRAHEAMLLRKYLPVAGGPALIDFVRTMALEIDQIGAKSADACFSFLYPQSAKIPFVVTDFITPELTRKDSAATLAVIESGFADPQPIPAQPQIMTSLNRVFRHLSDRFGDSNVAGLAHPEALPHDMVCALYSSLYGEVLSLPSSEGVPLLSFLFGQGTSA